VTVDATRADRLPPADRTTRADRLPPADRAARLHAAGMAANDNGRPAEAVRKLRAGLRAIEGDDDPALLDIRGRLLVSLAWAETERGRVEAGFRVLDEAERLIPAAQRPILLGQRALLLKRSGRNDAALRQYDEAVAQLSDGPYPVDLLKALNNRSLVHLEAGRVQLARADLLRCGQIAARHGLARYGAFCRVNLGCLDVLAGDLPAALRAFTEARAEYEKLAPGRLPTLAVERARALLAAGLFAEADRELAYAAEQATAQRLSHTYADALQVRAEAALLAGQPAAAARWAREARTRFIGRDNARRAALAALLQLRAEFVTGAVPAGTLARRAQALAARLTRLGLPEDARVGGLVAARALLRAGQPAAAGRSTTRYGVPGRADRLDTRLLWRLTRAELADRAGRPAEASRHLVAGMAALHRHRTQFGCLDLLTGAAVHGTDLARAGLTAALASGSPAAVYRWSERVRAQALLLAPVRPPDDPTVAAALEELRQAQHALRAAELAGQPASGLRTRIERLRRTVREHSWSAPGHSGASGPGYAPLRAVTAALGPAALVAYLRDGAALQALVVVAGSASLVPLGGYAEAAEALLRLRADLDAQAGRSMPERLARAVAAATRHDAGTLAALLLDPLLPLVGERDLVVIPTGALIAVPWGVLPGCAGRPVTVAPSATTWYTAMSPGPRIPTAALLVAGPRNAAAPPEVAAIAPLYPHATVLTGPAATPAATLDALDRVDVAHVAAHGRYQPENALFSTLELAGGPLIGYDLQRLPRTPRMVVLSSCDVGLADVRPGDETLGMVTALLTTGSATIVASVAQVGDDTAQSVMVAYHHAIQAGQAPAAALAAAMLAGGAAGFVCFGAG
jgi:tetratricopeptide (TPR) repeat protein